MKLYVMLIVLVGYCSCQFGSIANDKTSEKGVVRILILGNSITRHGPLPSIGWKGNWGMAASSKEKDFVHVLIDMLQKHKPEKTIEYHEENIADWEKNFNNTFSEGLLNFKPDILVIRLGENVPEEYARANNYEGALVKLAKQFATEKTKTVITGNFWPSAFKEQAQKKVAKEQGFAFVDISDLNDDPRNRAIGKFEDSGVANHPSDFGMQNIAIRIFNAIVTSKLL